MGFSSSLSERQSFIEERKNWNFVSLPKGAVDDQGEKILFCPQDPYIIKKILSLYQPCIDPQSIFFASGDVTGWAAKAFIGCGHSVLITEPNVLHCESLLKTLKKLIAGEASKKEQSLREQRQAVKWVEGEKEKKKALEEKRSEKVLDLIRKFPSLTQELASKIIDIIGTSVADEESLTQQVREVASSMSQGLSYIHLSIGGHIYHLSKQQWTEICDELKDDDSKFFLLFNC